MKRTNSNESINFSGLRGLDISRHMTYQEQFAAKLRNLGNRFGDIVREAVYSHEARVAERQKAKEYRQSLGKLSLVDDNIIIQEAPYDWVTEPKERHLHLVEVIPTEQTPISNPDSEVLTSS